MRDIRLFILFLVMFIPFTLKSQNKEKEEETSSQYFERLWKKMKEDDKEKKRKSDSLWAVQSIINDSIRESNKQINEQKRISQQKKVDSISQAGLNKSEKVEKLYDRFTLSLYGMSRNKLFTVFRGIDYDYADLRFSLYLQDDIMRLALVDDYIIKENYVYAKYISKVSSNNEYLTVKYNIKPHNDIIGYFESQYETEERTVYLIESVEITGTYHLIVRLFTNYWNQKISIGGNNKNAIANIQFLSDYIYLSKINANTAKITITKGNMTANYNKTYGINPAR